MKETDGTIIFELKCECPHCERDNDLMNIDEWWVIFGRNPNPCKDLNYEHDCEHCGQTFIIKNMEF